MCLFAVVYQESPECPLLVLANRDESTKRPSRSPSIASGEGSQGLWLGGRDLQAGGTWLGINRAGLIVAVTNRPKANVPQHPRSRGLLCRAVLEQDSWEAAEAEFHRQWQNEQFAGFNLMLLSRERGLVFSAGDQLNVETVTPGRHAITNGDWNDPADPRIARIRGLLEELKPNESVLETWIARAQTICRLGEQTGQAALCIDCAEGWGTVSSSIIALAKEPAQSRYLHAAGAPAAMPYQDYSPALQSLLEPPK